MDLTSYIVARMDIYRSQDLTSIIYRRADLNSYMFRRLIQVFGVPSHGPWCKNLRFTLTERLSDPDTRIRCLPSLSVCRTLTQEFNGLPLLGVCRTLTQEFGVYLHRTLSDPDTRIWCPGTLKRAPLRHLEHLLYVGHPLEGCPFDILYQCSLRPALFPVPHPTFIL